MPEVRDLKGLLIDCVQDLHGDEIETVEIYPLVIEAASSPGLRAALQEHREQSREQARRLERVAEALSTSAEGPACLWAGGILGDAKRDTETVTPGPLLDVALIGAIRKLEQSEVVSYETALAVARAMGLADAARLLEQTHGEEKAMDARLLTLLEKILGGVSATA